jgi:hypothetical protein
MERDPRRDDQTICTATAPEEVFTVRTYATQAPYDPTASAQICTRIELNPQLTALPDARTRNSDKSQVIDFHAFRRVLFPNLFPNRKSLRLRVSWENVDGRSHNGKHALFFPTFIKLVRTRAVDFG